MDYNKLDQELQLFKSQLSSFQNRGTQISATRARSHLLNLKKECDSLRKQLLAAAKEKKASKTARVVPAAEPEPESASEHTEPESMPSELPKLPKKARKSKKPM